MLGAGKEGEALKGAAKYVIWPSSIPPSDLSPPFKANLFSSGTVLDAFQPAVTQYSIAL